VTFRIRQTAATPVNENSGHIAPATGNGPRQPTTLMSDSVTAVQAKPSQAKMPIISDETWNFISQIPILK